MIQGADSLGQDDTESSRPIHIRVDGNCSMVGIDNSFDDVESKSHAHFATLILRHAIIAIEHLRLILFWNSWSEIGDRNFDSLRVLL